MSNRSVQTSARHYGIYAVGSVLIVALAISTGWAINTTNRADTIAKQAISKAQSQDAVVANLAAQGITPLSPDKASNNNGTAKDLIYLIEEEKLARDVYQAMYDKWGSRVFGNIKDSETTHQNLVGAVMQSRNLSDPRVTSSGVFVDSKLQTLYNQLIAQGNQSAREAYKVGIAIEELDIADLKEFISVLDPKDTDVKFVLDNLLHGSENHLRAFTRQSSR